MVSLFDEKQPDIFDTTCRYLDDILNINAIYFDDMVIKTYPAVLQRN